jgi:hypothetical protein
MSVPFQGTAFVRPSIAILTFYLHLKCWLRGTGWRRSLAHRVETKRALNQHPWELKLVWLFFFKKK